MLQRAQQIKIRVGDLHNQLSQCLLAPDLGDKNKCLGFGADCLFW